MAEAALLALRHTERNVLLVPDAIHPHTRRTLDTYFYESTATKVVTIACTDGTIDLNDLDAKLNAHQNQVAAVIMQTPNFF